MARVLIIEDDEKIRTLLTRMLGLEGFDVVHASTVKAGLRKLEQFDCEVVLSDVKLPDANGIESISRIKEKSPLSEIILLTAYATIGDSVHAIKSGAFDYIAKGDDNLKIIPLVYKATEKAELAQRVRKLELQIGGKHSFATIIGTSKAITAAIDLAKRVASTDTTVLLTGETGTGKEVFAQSIHKASKRSGRAFVAVNCSAFSRDLLESAMFGHRAGAFTGAVKDSIGLFEEAHEGSIFLDEIAEMNLELQAKLLRVLETGDFQRVGDTKTTRVDVRIIAATHRDLEEEIQSGRFRQDLYYRLSAFIIRIPALDERVADIELFVHHFIEVFGRKTNKRISACSAEYLEHLRRHHWRGNVRELKNVVERSVILADSDVIDINTLSPEFRSAGLDDSRVTGSEQLDLASAERRHILKILNYTSGNKAEAARLLDIALTTLYRKLEEYES